MHCFHAAGDVHQYVRYAEGTNGAEHRLVTQSTGYIVYNGGSVLLARHFSHIASERIHRYGQSGELLAQYAERRAQASHLLGFVGQFVPRPRRASTYIYHRTTLGNNLLNTLGNCLVATSAAARIEGIGRYINYSHHLGRRKIHNLPVEV